MAKKNRQMRRREKKKGHLPPETLVAHARQHLNAGRAREALDLLREAQHKDEQQEGLMALLFCAYAQRARQLILKEMPKEAEVMQARADACRAQVDCQALSAEDFVRVVAALPVVDAVVVYAKALPMRKGLMGVERHLADQMVVEQDFEAVSALPESHFLRQDAPVMADSVGAMEKGDWARAAEMLSAISRQSPFAPWRAFCRGMACFCSEDDEGAQRAAQVIPQDFVLAQVAAEWASGAHGQALLWEGVGDAGDVAQQVVTAIQKGRVRDIEPLIPKLAHALYPENPRMMGASLLCVLGIAAGKNGLPPQDVARLVHRLLPETQARLVMGKIGLVMQTVGGMLDVGPAQIYLTHVTTEFPDAARQALAKGCVLEHLARKVHQSGFLHGVSPAQRTDLKALLGHVPQDTTVLDVELMLKSLEADPDNRAGYAFLLKILSGRRSARHLSEKALEEMMRRFPEDPAPCLELANLYDAKNAYRKAEGALSEARRRAPHDERVLDRLAVGHLISAEQNRNRGRLPLSEKDYDAAEALGRHQVAVVLTVKRWALALMDRGLAAFPEIDQALQNRAPGDQLRLLSLLIHDVTGSGKWPQIEEKLMEMLYDRDGFVETISSAAVVALLTPIAPLFERVFKNLNVALVLSDFWPILLIRTEGEDVFLVFDALLGCGAQEAVRREIDRRLKGVDGEKRDVVLLFYLAVIRHMEGVDLGSRRFKEVLDRADAVQLRRLQAAALRLSAFAHGHLHEALRRFEFDGLDAHFSPFEMDFPDEDWDEDDDEEYDSPIEAIESLVDTHGLRGAPSYMLKEAAGVLRADATTRRMLNDIARLLDPLSQLLSREAHALLFPKRRRAR